MMTFQQFQETGRDCDDLETATSSDFGLDGKPVKGRLYADCLYIEDANSWDVGGRHQRGHWYLLLGRDDWFSDDLAELELRLYHWALLEGYCETHLDPIPATEAIVEAALNAACKSIQDAIGQTDGGVAAHFFNGGNGESTDIRPILRRYLDIELRG